MSKLADLMTLENFDWVVEANADDQQIIADTYAEYAEAISAVKRRNGFDEIRFGLDGSVYGWTDMLSPARRKALSSV